MKTRLSKQFISNKHFLRPIIVWLHWNAIDWNN